MPIDARRPSPRLRLILAMVALAAVLASVPAAAQGVADEANLLFRRGAQFFKVGKHEDALLSFLGSNRLVRNKNALFNIGLCYLRSAQYSEAFRFFSEYVKEPLTEVEQATVRKYVEEIRPRLALVKVTSTPPGAAIFIDRKDLGARGTTPSTFALAPGPHTIYVELPAHANEQSAVQAVTGQEAALALPLRRVLGTVEIVGSPADAEVRVDRDHGPPGGVIPARLRLSPGRHALYISRDGYHSARSDIEVTGGSSARVDVLLEKLPPAPGKLVVNANRRGALVLIDGQPAGLTPAILDVAAGRHRVVVTSEDYASFTREVVIAPGERLGIDARLSFASEAEVAVASKMLQRVEDAPASITVLTADEIQAFGYRTLGEALRGVRGFYLSDNRQYEYAGVRGLSPPGDFNNRFLLLADGHSLNDIWAGASFIGHDFSPDLDDIERIAVVRGPGSALYGTGALFSVVDVTTFGRQDHRLELGLAGGSVGEVYARISGAQELGRAGRMRLAASTLYSPRGASFTDPDSGGEIAENDGERAINVNGKATAGNFTFLGRYNTRKKYLPTTAFGIVPGTGLAYVSDGRAFFETRWERKVKPGVHLTIRGYYDHSDYHGRWPYEAEEPDQLEVLPDSAIADWLGLEARAVAELGERWRVVAGAEGLYAPRVHMEAGPGPDLALDDTRSFGVVSAYALAEARLLPNLTLSAGVRGDYYSLISSSAVSPRAAVVWRPYGRGTTKLMFGRAFRAPTVYELYYHDGGESQIPSDHLSPETIYSYEVEHTHAFGRRFFATVSVYLNDVRGLIGTGEVPEGAVVNEIGCPTGGCVWYTNVGHIATLGGEVELRRTWGADGSVAVAYALQRSRNLEQREDGTTAPFFGWSSVPISNSPEHLAYLRFARPVIGRLLVVGAELNYASSRLDRDLITRTDNMLLCNLTLSGQFREAGLKYSFGVYNLFDWRYRVPLSDDYSESQLELPQAGRAFVAKLAAAF